MRTKNLLGLLTVGLLFTAFASAQKTENRPVGNFTKISMGISGDIYISQGTTPELKVEAEEDVLELIVTEVNNDELKIRFSKPWVNNKKSIKIWVTTPELQGLYLSGSGNMITETAIKADEMELKLSGSGNINTRDLTCKELDAAISGSGSIDVSGKADEMSIAISGSGNCNADAFQTEETEVHISGSGNCKVNASKDLTVAVSGSGSVYYTGQPVIDASVSGSGKVRKL